MKRITFSILILIFFVVVSSAEADGGKLMLNIERVGELYRVISAVAYPNAPSPVSIGGNTRYRLYSKDGAEIASGNVRIPLVVAQEYADRTGQLHGRLERVERYTISLPLFSDVAGIELRRGTSLILDESIFPDTFRPKRAHAAQTSEPLSFAPLLRDLTSETSRSAPANTKVSPAKKDRITGTIKVKGVKDISLIRTELYFYPLDGTFREHIDVKTSGVSEFKVRLPRGAYRITAYCYYRDPEADGREVLLYPGAKIVTSFDSSEKSIKLKWKNSTLFTGQLQFAGKPIPGVVFIVDRIARPETHKTYTVARIPTDQNGRFAVRLPRKNFVMIAIPSPGSSAGEKLSIINVEKTNIDVPISLPALESVGGDDLKKIWDSGPEGSRLNIMFLAEAYTNGHESFTDTNSNGWWDGDLLLDLNNNSIHDNGEYFYDRNANRVYDPPEPFKDLNGDGICNRYERARFELDAALNTAALLSFPPFDRYSDVINVYTYWQASEHGVPRLTQFSQWKEMNTAWGVYGTAASGFQSANISTNPKSTAQEILPGAHEIVPVVISHDPINVLRANAQFGFGRVLMSAEDNRAGATLIHEFGHSIGNLWDEYLYSESTNRYIGGEPSSLNVTQYSNPSKAKWSNLLPRGVPVPTPENRDGYGLFEGAGGYSLGIYRSTAISMMRSTAYPYFIVNENAMAAVLELFR